MRAWRLDARIRIQADADLIRGQNKSYNEEVKRRKDERRKRMKWYINVLFLFSIKMAVTKGELDEKVPGNL